MRTIRIFRDRSGRISGGLLFGLLLATGCATKITEAESTISYDRASNDGADLDVAAADVTVLRHVTKNEVVQVGANLFGQHQKLDPDESVSGSDDDTAKVALVGFAPIVRLNLPAKRAAGAVIPYVEAGPGLCYVSADLGGESESDTAFMFMVGAGLRAFLSKDIAVDLAAQYRFFAVDDELGGDLDLFRVAIGFSVFF